MARAAKKRQAKADKEKKEGEEEEEEEEEEIAQPRTAVAKATAAAEAKAAWMLIEAAADDWPPMSAERMADGACHPDKIGLRLALDQQQQQGRGGT
jgi:hypothetical protein